MSLAEFTETQRFLFAADKNLIFSTYAFRSPPYDFQTTSGLKPWTTVAFWNTHIFSRRLTVKS
jgi:hypothetical protein